MSEPKKLYLIFKKLRSTNPIINIYPWDNNSGSPDYYHRNLMNRRRKFLSKYPLNFNVRKKLRYKLSGDVIKKPTITDIQKWFSIHTMRLIDPQFDRYLSRDNPNINLINRRINFL